jgi:mRNA interferase YafQ
MLKQRFSGSFKRERKLMQKRGKDIHKLTEVMDLIINEKPLPPERHNHPLHGEWEGSFECHIQGDCHLIYKLNPEARTVTFYSTGSHSDLF